MIGVLMGALTAAVETVEGLPASAVVAPLRDAGMALIIPGLLGSAILSGNIHAFTLAFAVAINTILYFAVGWLLYPLGARIKRLWQR
jgi:hypothetical protein